MGNKNVMEVNGLVVAASERISMEECVGLLLMLYNADLDICFCILVCDKVMTVWKNIHVNQCYKFTNLKVGMLQTSSSGKIFLLKTTDTSTFSHMDRAQVKKFHLEESLKSLILVPGINELVSDSSAAESNFISYQGFVTEVKNLEMGIYELDSKVLLYTTFNIGCRRFSLGSEVIISNAHLIKYMGASMLVCCGLSCVKNSKPKDAIGESLSLPYDSYFGNFCFQYGLNVFDLLWFERLLSRLKKKFSSLIDDEEVLYQQDSEFLKSILEYFLCAEYETANKKLSLVEEFLSSPHRCFPFSQSRLPTGCCVPYLTSIVDEVLESAAWMDAGPRWKFCVGSPRNSVIIGILYISINGNFYIVDRTLKLSVILTEDCDACCHDHNTIKDFKSSKCASVVAVQEYDVIVENISCKNGIQLPIRYLRTTFCRLYPLLPLCKSPAGNFFALKNFSRESEKNAENTDPVFPCESEKNAENINPGFLLESEKNSKTVDSVFSCEPKKNSENIDSVFSCEPRMNSENIDSVSSCEPKKNAENVSGFHSDSQEMSRRFLVLSRIWTVQNKITSCSRVLIFLLPENSQSVCDVTKGNQSVLEDTFNFYDSGDDVEFADLISKLDFLHIGEKEAQIGYLCFDDVIQDSVVFPGHIYAVAPKGGKANFNLTFEDSSRRIFTWNVTPDIQLIHDPECTGNHSVEDYEFAECYGIKEIISKRQLNRSWVVSCILQDKTYEDVENINEGKSRKESTATLCLSVRDCNSEDGSIKVYVPRFPGHLPGLLPGALLQLFGFLCFCSQSGCLYLRTSSAFGILVKQPNTLSGKCRSENFPDALSGNAFHCPVQSLCFVVKIVSAEISLACRECGRSFPKRCSCYSQQKTKLKLNALIDDGNRQLLAHCHDETAKKILGIDSKEWLALASYVEGSHRLLKYSDKAFWSKSALLPVMNQVFNTYCSSKATSRQMMFEYTPLPRPYSSPADVPSVWCRSADSVDCQKHARSLYLKLMEHDCNSSDEGHQFGISK